MANENVAESDCRIRRSSFIFVSESFGSSRGLFPFPEIDPNNAESPRRLQRTRCFQTPPFSFNKKWKKKDIYTYTYKIFRAVLRIIPDEGWIRAHARLFFGRKKMESKYIASTRVRKFFDPRNPDRRHSGGRDSNGPFVGNKLKIR